MKTRMLFFSISVCLFFPIGGLEKEQLLQKITQYAGPKRLLFSYPRSANTWMRYFLEVTTACPTFHRFGLKDSRNHPLGWTAGFYVDCDKAPIEKIHTGKELEKINANPEADDLIIIVRNPKEVLKRHGNKEITFDFLHGIGCSGNADARIYFENLSIYGRWHPDHRLLIYYEDLMTDPKKVFQAVLRFLGHDGAPIEDFMSHYESHKRKAISLYKESSSEGNDILYHSKKMRPEVRKQIDTWIEELYPDVWQNYLQHRFAEENVVY